MTEKKQRKPQDAVVENVKRLRAEVRALAKKHTQTVRQLNAVVKQLNALNKERAL